MTLRTGQDELRTANKGQVTDHYAKATEQPASTKREVRTAAVDALERIAADSPRDRLTIRDVLAAYIREHDPSPATEPDRLPKEFNTDGCTAEGGMRPDRLLDAVDAREQLGPSVRVTPPAKAPASPVPVRAAAGCGC